MAKPAAHLRDSQLQVEPGQRVATRLVVRNNASTVGQYRVSIPHFCDAARWVTFQSKDNPSGDRNHIDLSLLGGDEVEVAVAFEPPATTATPPGRTDYLIAVDALEADQESTAVEGWLDVAPIAATRTRVAPKRAGGRRRGRYRIAVLNSGNTSARVRLGVDDFDSEAISITWSPKEIELRPEEQGEFLAEVTPRRTKLTGRPERHRATFASRALTERGQSDPSEQKPVEFNQQVWIPPFVLALGAAVIAAGAAFMLLRPSEEPVIVPPNPPTELAGHADVGQANLSWLPDKRALKTEIRLIDCASRIQQGEALTFEGGAATFLLPPADETAASIGPPSLCFEGRSIGAAEQASIWAPTAPMARASTTIVAPSDLRLEDGTLAWTAVEETEYELIVDNAPFRTFLASPIRLLDLALPVGLHELRMRTLADGQVSAPSDPISFTMPEPAAEVAAGETAPGADDGVAADSSPAGSTAGLPPGLPSGSDTGTVSGASQPEPVLIEGPWVLFALDPLGPDDTAVASVQHFAAAVGDRFATRTADITRLFLSPDQPGPTGDPIVWLKQSQPGQAGQPAESVEIGGKWIIADTGAGLSADDAVEYCSLILDAMSASKAQPGFFCVPFDGAGRQLQVTPRSTDGPGSGSPGEPPTAGAGS